MLYMLEVSMKQNLGSDSQVQIQIQIHIHIHLTSFFLGQSPDWQLRLIKAPFTRARVCFNPPQWVNPSMVNLQ